MRLKEERIKVLNAERAKEVVLRFNNATPIYEVVQMQEYMNFLKAAVILFGKYQTTNRQFLLSKLGRPPTHHEFDFQYLA